MEDTDFLSDMSDSEYLQLLQNMSNEELFRELESNPRALEMISQDQRLEGQRRRSLIRRQVLNATMNTETQEELNQGTVYEDTNELAAGPNGLNPGINSQPTPAAPSNVPISNIIPTSTPTNNGSNLGVNDSTAAGMDRRNQP